MSLADILTSDNLFLIDIEALQEEGILNKLTEIAQDPQFDLEPGRAKEFYQQLDKLVKDNEAQLRTKPIIFNNLMGILLMFSWKTLAGTSLKNTKNILSDNLVNSIGLGVDIRACLEKIISIYEFRIGPDKETRRSWIYSLEHNQEKLGTKAITLDTGPVQPTIENWLKAYNLIQPLGKARATFNQVTFLNRSKEAGQLSLSEKEVLKKIIDLYDWLLFPPPGPEIIPDESMPQKTTPYIQSKKFGLPENLQSQPPAQKPALPAKPTPPTVEPKAPEAPKPVLQKSAPLPAQPIKLPPINLPSSRPPTKPVNIQEILKNKEKLQPAAALKPPAPFNPASQKPDIDKKLKDLDQRAQSKN